MKDLYDSKEVCMIFSNEEIIEHLVKPLKENTKINIEILDKDENSLHTNSDVAIKYIDLGNNEEGFEFHIAFYGRQTSIFIFNEEIMFLDDKAKKNFCGCDTYHNVVYEGTLRNKTHSQILNLFYEVINVLVDAKSISIKESNKTQIGVEYPKYDYMVNIKTIDGEKSEHKLENIKFIRN